MKAVILAAGKGTRMGELTKTTPKALLMKKGKPLIQHGLEVLPAGVSEIIIVIEYLGEQIKEFVGEKWNGIPVRYVEQGKRKGTGGALWETQEFLVSQSFFVLPCDDLYSPDDMKEISSAAPAMLVSKVTDRVCSGGNVQMDEQSNLLAIEEGTHQPPCWLATGAYFLDDNIFNFPLVQIPGKDEYGLPQSLVAYSKKHPVRIVEARQWEQVVTDKDVD
jgi:UDP-N-acetylglucosamine diphosphorylase / glucose-1-phosphate thymidylyltransferase / UDP-N-acetylgalactosamine diphosphorylase / glucosamine-1-phosphate N-acetyltransferase / galactosamine-1-phosphate N-acetyltransferase